MNGNSLLQKLFLNKKFVAVLSLVTAFVFWLIITVTENPVREITFSDISISVFTDGTAAGDMGLDLVSISDVKASVKLSGPSYALSSLSSNDISVSVPLNDVTEAGTYEIALSVASAKTQDITIVGVTPSVITAVFDYTDSFDFPIEVEAKGAKAAQGLVAYTPSVSDSSQATITISGARSDIEKISRVVAFAEVNETLSTTQSYDAQIHLYDENGDELNKSLYTIPLETVKITVPIFKQKEVSLNASFANKPEGLTAKDLSYTLSQRNITILGPESTVDSITSVSLADIDFSSISKSNNVFEVAPVLPNGVKIADNIETVTVTIDTSSFEETTVNVTKFEFKNVANGLSVTSAGVKNVKICGPKSVIRSINTADLYALADLSGKTSGEYTVSVRVYSKANNNIWQVGNYTVVVTLK